MRLCGIRGTFLVFAATGCVMTSCAGEEDDAQGTGGVAGSGGSKGGFAGSGAFAGSAGRRDAGTDARDAGSTRSPLGAACTSDADCGGQGLTCAQAGSGMFAGGGPAKGLCTTPCQTGAESDCERFGAGSICVNYGTEQAPSRFCAEGCTFGGGTSPDPTKCHGRREVACAPLSNNQGAILPTCVPQCNTNEDCGSNLFCDQRTGLCSTTERTGDLLGTKCQDPGVDGSVDTCRGSCTGIVVASGLPAVTHRCSERCTWGVVPSCGWTPGSGKADAYCLFFSTSIPDVGFGDRGSCGQLCDCNGDCRSPDLICTALSGSLRQATGRQGYCTIPQGTDGGPRPNLPCDGGGAGTGGAAGAAGSAGSPNDASTD